MLCSNYIYRAQNWVLSTKTGISTLRKPAYSVWHKEKGIWKAKDRISNCDKKQFPYIVKWKEVEKEINFISLDSRHGIQFINNTDDLGEQSETLHNETCFYIPPCLVIIVFTCWPQMSEGSNKEIPRVDFKLSAIPEAVSNIEFSWLQFLLIRKWHWFVHGP